MGGKVFLLAALCVLVAPALGQGGFLAQLFGGGRAPRPQRPQFRPAPPARAPRPQPLRQGRVVTQDSQNSQPRPSTFTRPSQPSQAQSFNPSQQSTPAQSFSRPSQPSQPSQPQSFSRPSQPSQPQSFSRPSQPSQASQPQSSASQASGATRGKVIVIPLPKDASGGDVYPDCNRGKVCLPEAQECAIRKSKIGATTFQNKTYWFSWQSDEQVLREGSWNWFTARNYCRKRCMDLVSFETPEEWSIVKSFMSGAGIKEIWTSGRLCDAEVSGCEADHYQPLNINGWFWASTLVKMLPTNRPVGLNPDGVRVIGVNEWDSTGSKGRPQPDGFTPEGGLGEEPCMAVIGEKWHDTSCHNRRAIVCEDLPAQNIQFVRNENPGINIP